MEPETFEMWAEKTFKGFLLFEKEMIEPFTKEAWEAATKQEYKRLINAINIAIKEKENSGE